MCGSCREHFREKTRRWRKANPEKVKEIGRRADKKRYVIKRKYDKYWRNKNPKRVREYKLRDKEKHAERIRNYMIQWWKEHPEKRRIYEHNRKARKRENGGTLTFGELNEQFELQEGLCFYCGRLLDDNSTHIDHRVPISRGGSNSIENIALSCPSCNLKKHTKTDIEFLQEINNDR
jgi:5-methylcytosine-specific restriction endonuclease McrA